MSLLVVMGSGETAPTMVKVHREVIAESAAAAGGGPAVVGFLDKQYRLLLRVP